MLRTASVPCWVLLLVLWSSAAEADDRPFVYTLDADGPTDVEVEARYSLNVGATESGAVRFVDQTLARSGVVQQIGVQAGLAPWIAIGAFGLVATDDGQSQATGGGYVGFTLLRPTLHEGEARARGGSIGIQLWALREFEGDAALSARLLAGYDRGPYSLAFDLQLEKRFADGADPLDVLFRMGFGRELVRGPRGSYRLGIEYVGQDLEDYIEDEEAEGGAVHLLALSNVALLDDEHLTLGLASGLVLARGTVGFGARASVYYRF